MLRTLVKKQLLSLFASWFRAGKDGKKRSGAALLGFLVLMVYVIGVFFFLFLSMMHSLCAPLLTAGMGWLYFSIAALMALLLAVIGSVFLTQSTLYEAKDNEFLLSLPIPPAQILFSRIIGLYLQNFLFTGLVFLPAIIVYGQTTEMGTASLVFCLLLLFLLPLLSLSLSCVLAWLTALITSHMRSKTLFTMVLSLAFLGLYFYFYFRISYYLQLLLVNSKEIGESIRHALYPMYQMGLAAEGNGLAFLWFSLLTMFLFAVIYFALSRSFLRIATARRGAAKAKYREKALRAHSVEQCLFRKELRRFTGSATYMINCSLGNLILLACAVLIVIKRDLLWSLSAQVSGFHIVLPALCCLALCLASSPDAVSAPSVSLEGNTLWLLRSLPVSGKQLLAAKLKLHMAINLPAVLLCGVVLDLVLLPSLPMAILMLLLPCVFLLLCGEIGLLLNLCFPKLDWTNEAMVVKQSMSVVLSVFAGMGISLFLLLLYFLLPSKLVPDVWFLTICTVLIAVADALFWRLLAGWGSRRLLSLS